MDSLPASLDSQDLKQYEDKPVIFGVIDRSKKMFVHLNNSFHRLTGLRAKDFVGKPNTLQRLVHCDKEVKAFVQPTAITFRQRWLDKNGNELDVFCVSIPHGKHSYINGVVLGPTHNP